MNTAKIYTDSEGNESTIREMIRREPEWIENRIQAGEDAIEKVKQLQDFAIWMTGCGYDFCQHDYFCEQRDKLLKQNEGCKNQEGINNEKEIKVKD